MDHIEFEWDPTKASANFRKHGVGFVEATTVFRDGSLSKDRSASCTARNGR